MKKKKDPKWVAAGKKGNATIRKKAGDARMSEIASAAAATRKENQKKKVSRRANRA
jgi:hypothetical protein